MTRLALALLLIAACGSEDHGGPAPTPAPTAASGGGDPGSGGAAATAPVKRTVIQRNPFGNVAEADNLLWDGDFEWRAPFADQYGWLSGSNSYISYALPRLALAERCRSGIKCAEIPPGEQIVGLSIGSRDRALRVSFWARPASGPCGSVVGLLSSLSAPGPTLAVPSTSKAPDANGWCRYESLVSVSPAAPFLFIRNDATEPVVVDDAVIVAVDLGEASVVSAPPVEVAEMPAIRASLKKALEPRRPPPSAAQQRFEQRLRRLTRGLR